MHGHHVPNGLWLAADGGPESYGVAVRMAFDGERTNITQVTVVSESDVRPKHLDVNLEALHRWVSRFSYSVESVAQLPGGLEVRRAAPPDVGPLRERLERSRRNRKITRTFLEEVAKIYRANSGPGGKPTKAVREHFAASERQASTYVQRARQAGLLPPTTPGQKRG